MEGDTQDLCVSFTIAETIEVVSNMFGTDMDRLANATKQLQQRIQHAGNDQSQDLKGDDALGPILAFFARHKTGVALLANAISLVSDRENAVKTEEKLNQMRTAVEQFQNLEGEEFGGELLSADVVGFSRQRAEISEDELTPQHKLKLLCIVSDMWAAVSQKLKLFLTHNVSGLTEVAIEAFLNKGMIREDPALT